MLLLSSTRHTRWPRSGEILHTGVVGLELTNPYAELLTVEARLALTETEAGATSLLTDREG